MSVCEVVVDVIRCRILECSETMSERQRRIACVQLDPIPGQVHKNVDKVLELTKDLVPGSLDMLVLPEMALTGYIFSNSAEIEHLLEDPYEETNQSSSSPSLQLAKQLATRLRCYVVIGFPMRAKGSTVHGRITSSTPLDARTAELVSHEVVEGSQGCFNAALLLNEQGHLIHVFLKHFSYENDKTWACEGPGFQSVNLPGFGKVCIAICMDLNPYDFKAPFESFELATFCKSEKVEVLIMPMAWLLATSSEDDEDVKSNSEEDGKVDTLHEGPHEQTINYWALRLSPFLEEKATYQDFYFVNCNRTGTEKTSKFAGSSCALHFSQKHRREGATGPSVALLGAMGRQESVQVFHLP